MTINEWMIANDADFGHDNATFVYRKVVITTLVCRTREEDCIRTIARFLHGNGPRNIFVLLIH